MSKRQNVEIIEKLLLKLKERDATFAELERSLNTGYNTIKKNCQLLQKLGQLNITRKEKHPKNGRETYIVSLTSEGAKSINNFKKR